MAKLLSDKEFELLIDKVLVNGDKSNIKPNSYALRLGKYGEFINTNKHFELGKKKKGIVVQPGHSVGLTAFETIDFRREVVQKIFPDCDLHAFLSPTTDLAREGIVAPTTQIDAGYTGTLNWTINNTSNVERRFIYKEKLFRLTIFKLEKGETPENVYTGAYQDQEGYVTSRRAGAPIGMRADEWVNSTTEKGPEKLLDNLVNSGYPWNLLGKRLLIIDEQFKSVTEEYSRIYDSMEAMKAEVHELSSEQKNFAQKIPTSVRENLKEEATSLQNRWMLGATSMILALIGIILTVVSNETSFSFFKSNGSIIGIVLIILACVGIFIISRNSNKK